MRSKCIMIFGLLAFLINVSAVAEGVSIAYDVDVFWDLLPSDPVKPDPVGVYLNGRYLGKSAQAFQMLADLPLARGQRAKISLQLRREDGTSVSQPYSRSHFLQIWLRNGVTVDFFESGKKLNCHTITFGSFWRNGDFIESLNDALWYGDGKLVGDGVAMSKRLTEWAAEGDVVIHDLEPLGFVDYNPLMPTGGGPYKTLFRLTGLRNVQRIIVVPDLEVSRRYFREVIVPGGDVDVP